MLKKINTIDFRLYRVNNIGEIYLSDIEVQYVFVNNLVGSKLEFDVIVEQYLEMFDTNHRLDESEHIREWFHISCTGRFQKQVLGQLFLRIILLG